jgi:predicted branched-subunit amino acid permease
VLDAALGFMLTALFLALLASVLTRANLAVALVAGIATVVGTLALGGTYGLLAGIAIGALSGAVLPGRRAR